MIKTINVKYPPGTPRSTSPASTFSGTLLSTEQAERYRNERVDALLSEAVKTERISQSDVAEYYELLSKLQGITDDPAERAEVLKRMGDSCFDGGRG